MQKIWFNAPTFGAKPLLSVLIVLLLRHTGGGNTYFRHKTDPSTRYIWHNNKWNQEIPLKIHNSSRRKYTINTNFPVSLYKNMSRNNPCLKRIACVSMQNINPKSFSLEHSLPVLHAAGLHDNAHPHSSVRQHFCINRSSWWHIALHLAVQI